MSTRNHFTTIAARHRKARFSMATFGHDHSIAKVLGAPVALVCALLFSSVCHASPYTTSVLATGPTIYYDLDTNTNDLATVAGGVNNGLLSFDAALGAAGPRPVDGFDNMSATNGALAVDGLNDTVVYDQVFNGAGVTTGAYSVQTWFNSSVPFGDKVLSYVLGRGELGVTRDSVGVGGTAAPAIIPIGQLFIFDGVSDSTIAVGDTVLAEDTWYHTLLVRDGNNVKVYLNGEEEFSTVFAWAGGDGDFVTFGGRADYLNAGEGTLTLNGRVDETAVWNRALTADEAALLFQSAFAPASVPEPSSIVLWLVAFVGFALMAWLRKR